MMKQWCGMIVGSAFAAAALAQTAAVGKTYEVTVATEVGNHFSGAFGEARIGKVVLLIPEGKVGEKYSVTITEIKENGFTGTQQASCTFQQVGGERDGRKGQCNPAPGG